MYMHDLAVCSFYLHKTQNTGRLLIFVFQLETIQKQLDNLG